MLDRTFLAAFLAKSALAFGIDPAIARRVAEDSIESACPAPRPDPHKARGRELATTAAD